MASHDEIGRNVRKHLRHSECSGPFCKYEMYNGKQLQKSNVKAVGKQLYESKERVVERKTSTGINVRTVIL